MDLEIVADKFCSDCCTQMQNNSVNVVTSGKITIHDIKIKPRGRPKGPICSMLIACYFNPVCQKGSGIFYEFENGFSMVTGLYVSNCFSFLRNCNPQFGIHFPESYTHENDMSRVYFQVLLCRD